MIAEQRAAALLPYEWLLAMQADRHRPAGGRFRRFFAVLGPGLIAGAADDDPSAIATYSIAGAQLGTSVLWDRVHHLAADCLPRRDRQILQCHLRTDGCSLFWDRGQDGCRIVAYDFALKWW